MGLDRIFRVASATTARSFKTAITIGSGLSARVVYGRFFDGTKIEQDPLGGPDIYSAVPFISITDADAAGVAEGALISAPGGNYKVRTVLPNGYGLTDLILVLDDA